MPSKPTSDVLVHKNVMIPMHDGVHLAADIYRPARGLEPVPGRQPALLERTPYSKDQADRVELNGLWYTQRGYAVVIQDVRGRYRSEGEFTFLRNEPRDGSDTVEWIAAQPWCDGRVGTFGTSYMAWTQSALAALDPPHLRAMWVNQGGANAYTSTVRHNGAFELRFLCWALWQGAKSQEAKADPVLGRALGAVNVREWLTRTPLRPGASPLALIPRYEAWAFDLIRRGDYDPEFWGDPAFNVEAHWARHADVPMVFSGGWYDRPDTDFTAKLIDVYPPSADYPDGYAMNLTDSIIRARYREGDGRGRPLEPGRVVRLELPLYPTANRFAAGHRIRLDVSSSNFPRFDLNPNTGDPLWANTTVLVATNVVFHDSERASHVVLPLIPA